MTDARKEILARLGTGNGISAHQQAPLQPAFVIAAQSRVQLLKQKLEAVQTSVDIVSSESEIAASIAGFLESLDSPLEVGVVPGYDLSALDNDSGLRFYRCDDPATCHSLLSRAAYGIAETGSVVQASGPHSPTLANFLPDNCIFVLKEQHIFAYLEDALLQVQQGEAGMPRALNLISGPSKTADIEQTLVYGAHGPIQLHVIVVKEHR